MSGPLHPAYRFVTEAQWKACQFLGADRQTADARAGMKPFAPYGSPPTSLWPETGLPPSSAYAPAVTEDGDLLWRDTSGIMFRLREPDDLPRRSQAPLALAAARRIAVVAGRLWVVNQLGGLQAFDDQSLASGIDVNLEGVKAVDIAPDSREGLYVLGRADDRVVIVHLGCAGNTDHLIELDEPKEASELAFLGQSKTLVVLGAGKSKLFFIDAESGRLKHSVLLSALRSCFSIDVIGSDGCSRLFFAGTDGKAIGGKHHVLLVDEDGDLLGRIPIDETIADKDPEERRATGLAATRTQLFVSTDKGLLRFDPVDTVPQGAGEVRAALVTPLLRSPADGPQKWIRAEAKAVIPPGCSLEITIASANDPELRAKAEKILSDPSLPHAARFAEWERYVDRWPFTYRGDSALGSSEQLLSAPLHDAMEEYLWIEVALVAAPGGGMPVLNELAILYPGPTLIENLPAIYRRGELESGDFLRGLVGVLEAGTQGLDREIGNLGRHINPRTAEDDWLDYVASWLGLPWDNALGLDQKRRLVGRASAIADGYATRAGLEVLLDSLMPERPRRFRVVDMTAEFGLATIHGKGCEGSRLPAILAGLPATATELGNNSIIGEARLTCEGSDGGSSFLTGHVRIDVAASDEERALWEPWLKTLVDSMLPATVRGQIRWLARSTFEADRLIPELKLEDGPTAHLGQDAVTGAARLGGRPRTTLPGRLTRNSTLQ